MSRPHLDNFRSPPALIAFVGTCALGLAADLLTKVWAFRKLEMNSEAYQFIPGWLHFETTVNQGAVFGLGQGQRWLFVGVSILAIGFLSWLFASSERRQIGYHILLGMLLAGVLGNLYDRIAFGHVRDMIHALPGQRFSGTWQLPLLNYPPSDRQVFPYIFNVADMLLCTGVFLMIVYSFFHKPAENSSATDDSRATGIQDPV
ncbi:MAG: signal peptidase II [Anaerolineae bacterium]|nr:signal peptidase II [Phycisphaerae bacterium]